MGAPVRSLVALARRRSVRPLPATMEGLVHELSKQLSRSAKRQRREEESETTSNVSTVPENEVHPALLDEKCQERFLQSVDTMIVQSHDRRLLAGRSFIARMCYAVFMAVQAAKSIEYGIEWGALLYIAYYLVTNAYDGGPYDLNHSEGLATREMRCLVVSLGMAPICSTTEEDMMKMFRTLSRLSDPDLSDPMMRVWDKVAKDPKVRLAVQGVLYPCRRAHVLFTR